MNDLERSVLPYLGHVMVLRSSKTCLCPKDSWAPCGGQYEGRYADKCPEHGRGQGEARWGAEEHSPSECPVDRPKRSQAS